MGKKRKEYRAGVIGLGMGRNWCSAAADSPGLELAVVFDLDKTLSEVTAREFGAASAVSGEDFFSRDIDIAVVATPDHLHADHSVRALSAGKHVICEKPLAPTVEECLRIVRAVRESGRFLMAGQVCRYSPGFRTARRLAGEGAVGELAFIESEYAHDYTRLAGAGGWRKDPGIRREGFIGGGCHALDIVRWFGGDPVEAFCYTNRKLLPGWPTDDTGVCVCKLPGGVLGKVFVSTGAKRKYTMRTVIYGTAGTIICDNHGPAVRLFREEDSDCSGAKDFREIPVSARSHNVAAELEEFVDCLDRNVSPPTDVFEGTKTVAFGEAALLSAKSGKPEAVNYDYMEGE